MTTIYIKGLDNVILELESVMNTIKDTMCNTKGHFYNNKVTNKDSFLKKCDSLIAEFNKLISKIDIIEDALLLPNLNQSSIIEKIKEVFSKWSELNTEAIKFVSTSSF